MIYKETYTFTSDFQTTLEICDKNAHDMINQLSSNESAIFLIDEHVFSLYFNDNSLKNPYYIIKTGEKNKTLSQARKMYDFLFFRNCTRNHTLIVIGGGLSMDLGAWVAGTFKRGLKLWLVPTTLLGIVDASIGGKTAVNYQGIKNSIGQFYPAIKVIFCADFLKTLSQKEYYNGISETCKMLLITKDYNKLDLILMNKAVNDNDIWIVAKKKLELCEQDLFDQGVRRTLNLGHTFAHMFESVSRFKLSHGVAVAWGLHLAVQFSFVKKLITEDEYQFIHDKIRVLLRMDPRFKSHLALICNDDFVDQINEHFELLIRNDKKNDDRLNLVLFQNNLTVSIYNETNKIELRNFLLNKSWFFI